MYRIKQLLLASGDLAVLFLGLYISLFTRSLFASVPADPAYRSFSLLITPMSRLFAVCLVIMYIAGLYDITRLKNNWKFYRKILWSALAYILAGVTYFYLNIHLRVAPKTILALTAVFGFSLIALWRYIYTRFLSSAIWKSRVVFAGLTPDTKELAVRLIAEPERGYEVTGIVTFGEVGADPFLERLFISQEKFKDHIRENKAELIVISPEISSKKSLLKEMYDELFYQVEIITLAQFYEDIMQRIPPFTFSESWFLSNIREQQKKIYDRIRILIDYSIALLIGVVFIILFPLMAIAIKLNSPGPIFFHQERIGRQGRVFKMHKLRTMKAIGVGGSAETNGPVFTKNHDERITAVGHLLRRARLDELPQFINILRGEMAIIGPRPERPEFVEQLTKTMPFYSLRHLIKPGVTGWAQIHKSYYGTIEENLRKLEYDLYYIKNRGPWLDMAILLRTVSIVAKMIGR